MERLNSTPTIWDSKPTSTQKVDNVQQPFLDMAFVNNFFSKNLNIAKQILQSENLMYDKITIEFSTENFCYVVKINFDSYKDLYTECGTSISICTQPTADIQNAVETAIYSLKAIKKQKIAAVQIAEPQIKQLTIEQAIDTETKKEKKSKNSTQPEL